MDTITVMTSIKKRYEIILNPKYDTLITRDPIHYITPLGPAGSSDFPIIHPFHPIAEIAG